MTVKVRLVESQVQVPAERLRDVCPPRGVCSREQGHHFPSTPT